MVSSSWLSCCRDDQWCGKAPNADRIAAWVVLIKPMSWDRHRLKHWIEAAKKRLHRNVLAIALANKLARIAWGVLAGGRTFEASKLQIA
jgi:transposase